MKERDELRKNVAGELLRIGAVVFSPDEPFTWASGIRSPIYVDNRLTMTYPKVRSLITVGFADLLDDESLRPDVVVGTATAGIPHAAWLAGRLDLPMAYVRSAAKHHGKKNRIEGRIPEGSQVVIVEDLVSTGGSSLDAAEAVTTAGSDVVGVLAVFTYGLRSAAEAFASAGVQLLALTDFETLLDAAQRLGSIDAEQVRAVLSWYSRLVEGTNVGE